MEELIISILLITIGYIAGRVNEKKHYRSIEEREETFLNLPAVPSKNLFETNKDIKKVKLVTGSAVISIDYFKRFLAGLINVFGGNVSAYETLVDRARREAILRMKDKAKGADIVLNLRIETSSISKSTQNAVGSIEALAYGTAITYGSQKATEPKQKTQPSRPVASTEPSKTYQITFSGDIDAGQDIFEVKRKMAELFNVSEHKCNLMFSGHNLVLKRGLDYDKALKYKNTFDNTGAICQIEMEDTKS